MLLICFLLLSLMTFFVLDTIQLAARSKVLMFVDGSNTEIVGSNPAQDMDACPRFSVLYFLWA